jgi:hypothetical protein
LTFASQSKDGVTLSLSFSEALVLFEWLSRNWERTHWEQSEIFEDPAEKQLLILIEGDLAPLISETFAADYHELVCKAYRSILPENDG